MAKQHVQRKKPVVTTAAKERTGSWQVAKYAHVQQKARRWCCSSRDALQACSLCPRFELGRSSTRRNETSLRAHCRPPLHHHTGIYYSSPPAQRAARVSAAGATDCIRQHALHQTCFVAARALRGHCWFHCARRNRFGSQTS